MLSGAELTTNRARRFPQRVRSHPERQTEQRVESNAFRLTWQETVRALIGVVLLLAIVLLLMHRPIACSLLPGVGQTGGQTPKGEAVLYSRSGSLPAFKTRMALDRFLAGKLSRSPGVSRFLRGKLSRSPGVSSCSVVSGTQCSVLIETAYTAQVEILGENEHAGKVFWVDRKHIRRP